MSNFENNLKNITKFQWMIIKLLLVIVFYCLQIIWLILRVNPKPSLGFRAIAKIPYNIIRQYKVIWTLYRQLKKISIFYSFRKK